MPTLLSKQSPLAKPEEQIAALERANVPAFHDTINKAGLSPLMTGTVELMQINTGKLCNQTCRHCHVDAGPDRREIMSRETLEQCLLALRANPQITTVDITGGAPELNPEFKWFVQEVRRLGRRVMDRCNLTILTLPKYEDLPHFFKEHQVEIVASLPYFQEDRTDAQRGPGIFSKSIEALQRLNAVGYGDPEGPLTLDLVYNPSGAFLPPPQQSIEQDYRRELKNRYGIRFNRLYTITNMPISRFLEYLQESNNFERYMARLFSMFNPAAAAGVMCRSMISVGWDGTLYDCDFNQMLSIPVRGPRHIAELAAGIAQREIITGKHCYGCTAGAGSSCTGTISS